jgi:AcrR family transcriptional regulator
MAAVQNQKAERIAAIRAAAVRAFAAYGYSGARVEDIAAAAGVSKGAIYLHFPSKAALLEGVVRAAAAPTLDAIQAVSLGAGDPADTLRVVLARAKRALKTDLAPDFVKVLVTETTRSPVVQEVWRREALEPILAMIGEVVARGVASGAFRPIDPMIAARLLIAPAISAAIAMRSTDLLDTDTLLDAHADLFLAGLTSKS